jgi:HEAT repeat protein
MLKSENEAVVCEALRALSKIGAASDVPAMYEQFKKGGSIPNVANEALNDMRAKGVTQALMSIVQADPAQTGRVLGILGERMESATIPEFEKYLKSDNADLRRDSWKAISKIATEKNFPQLIAWLSLVKDEELNQAESCLRMVIKNTEQATRVAAIASAWTKSNVPSKRLLTSLMQTYQDASFVDLLKQAATDSNRDLSEAALRALADWNDMTPYAILKDSMATQTDPGLKTVALRGAVKLATAQAGKDARSLYIELLKSAPDDRNRMTVADALFKAEGFDFFTTLQGMFSEAPFAKKLYVEFFDKKIKGQTSQPGGVLEPKLWKADASHNGHNAKVAFDRNLGSRWDTGVSSTPGMWYTLDLGENAFLSEVVLDASPSSGDSPNGYEVFVSDDNKNWSGVVAKGDGNSAKNGINTIPLNAKGQYIKFVTTGGRNGLFWSIHEISIKTGVDEKKVQAIQAIADTLR